MAKAKVNKELCIGCGNCVQMCPEVFKMDDDNKSQVIADDCGSCNCQEVIESCPVSAITMEE